MYGVREVAKRKEKPEELEALVREIFSIHFFATSAFAVVYFITALCIPKLRMHLDLIFVGIGIMFFSVFS